MAEPVLRTERLTYRYPGAATAALGGLGVRVERGEFVVLAGRSGSGKSTLLRAACGLVPHFHGGEVEGALEVAGLDVRSHGPAELAGVVGLVAQDPETQVVSATVRAEIELPLELRGIPPAGRARAVEEVALALAIPDLLERSTDTLSGGELQRVALAAALATRPRLVLLDEPTSQLDPVAGDELISLLRRLNEEWGVAVLLGEHRLERCLAAADRVIALDDGMLAFDGAPTEFLDWALGADAALATPDARLLSGLGLPPAASVRQARRALADRGLALAVPEPAGDADEGGEGSRRASWLRRLRDRGGGEPTVLAVADLWVELGERPERTEAIRAAELRVGPGERVALMGRNGAGKTTLLRAAAGLLEPGRGRIEAPQGVALLPQRPGDLFTRERVGDELPGEAGAAALRRFGLEHLADLDPRDLSGGERQRLALAIVVAGRGPGEAGAPGCLLLDEPTRGMDRARKLDLAGLVRDLSEEGVAVVIATHDVEFATVFAERVVLLGRGEVVADGPVRQLLAGGWYFSSEVARILDGAAVTVEEALELLRRSSGVDSRRSAPARDGAR
jgi:energy-coupling factor transport system ATP-binding protein